MTLVMLCNLNGVSGALSLKKMWFSAALSLKSRQCCPVCHWNVVSAALLTKCWLMPLCDQDVVPAMRPVTQCHRLSVLLCNQNVAGAALSLKCGSVLLCHWKVVSAALLSKCCTMLLCNRNVVTAMHPVTGCYRYSVLFCNRNVVSAAL